MVHKKFPLPVFAFLPWVTFWSQGGSKLPDYAHLRIGIATDVSCKQIQKSFNATMVRTTESRSKGLGGRSTPLKKDESMLFLFDQAETVSFWMKDTLIPLELALFDDSGKLSELFEMPVEADPKDPKYRYTATHPAVVGLELAPKSLEALAHKTLTLCASTTGK
ncbi:MAG: DUF192 domain-containing protein [Deltaproteobacteria bacterium]|nr:DUF192 domain-containing protein [Deltaproteobacteria bacterium]